MPQQLDWLVDKRGKFVGHVLSCAIDTEGFLTGQGYVTEDKYMEVGTPLFVVEPYERKTRGEIRYGDRVSLANQVNIVPRFRKG
jgi:glycine hydroxymethyltransferase